MSAAALNAIWRRISRDPSAIAAYSLATVLALAFILQLYPLSFLAGSGLFFEQKDAPQHVSGWLFYLHDSWHFPLLQTTRLNHPDGVNIAFTDSIPLAALVFKLFAAWLPAQFHYFGLWHALALLSQALAAVLLMRALGVRHLAGCLAAAGFALTWPSLLWRFEHTALMTHGVILTALALYFMGRSGQWRSRRVSAAFIALSVAGLLIHPYLLAFSYAMFIVFLAEQAFAGAGWRKQVPALTTSVLVLMGAGVVFGYVGNGTQSFGFGSYSMNLSAPFCGGRFYSCVSATAEQPFKAFHFFDATGGQYEGYNYLGLGLILLVPCALWRGRNALLNVLRRFPVLCCAMLLLTLYALSNKVYFNGHELFSYPLPAFADKLTGTFRASGRFFWIVGYLILFATLATLLKKPSPRMFALVAFALALQWVDVQPMRAHNTATTSLPGKQELAQWATVLQDTQKIFLYPAFGCRENDPRFYLFFQRLAAHYDTLLDTGYIARPNLNCAANAQSFDMPFVAQQLYVMPREELKNPLAVPLGFRTAISQGACVTQQDALLCRADADAAYWRRSGLTGMTPLTDDFSRQVFSAAQLPTQVGVVDGDRLVPKPAQQEGFLSFGPYLRLHPGRYRVRLRYVSNADLTQQVGRWDIMANRSAKPALMWGGGSLVGTRGAVREIESVFSADDSAALVEIRTYLMATGDLQLLTIALEPAP